MKKIFSIVLLWSATLLTCDAQSKNFIDQPYIEVGGSADSLVSPDRIFIKITISEKDTRDKISLEESENKMVTALKSLGINTEADLEARDMLSNYKYYFLKQKDVIKTKEYILKVVNGPMVSKAFIQLEQLGIANAAIDRAERSDIEKIRNECRMKAVMDAKTKAMAMTATLGQNIGNAIFISDNEVNISNMLQGQVAGLQIRGYKSMEQNQYEPENIEFEKIKVQASVNVKFILK